MTLWDIPAKKSALISGLDHSLLPAVMNRLLEMGLTDGQSVRCLRRSGYKPFLLSSGARLAPI